MLGSLLMPAQGCQAWRRFDQALRSGRVPAREVLEHRMVASMTARRGPW